MKEITIKIYGWSDLKKWFWDKFLFPRRNVVVMWLTYYHDETKSLFAKLLLKHNNNDLENDYALLLEALKDWDEESKKILEDTIEFIMMK